MILPKENEYYLTSDKTLSRFNQKYWIYNWKGIVWFIIDNENASKVIMGDNFKYFHRFDMEPSVKILKSFIL